MKDMTLFYKQYNLNKYEFSKMAHVGTKNLVRYAKGDDTLHESTVTKIERAIHIVETNNLVRPRLKGGTRPGNVWAYNKLNKEICRYMMNFEKLFNEEEA